MSKVVVKHYEKNKMLTKQVKENKAKKDYTMEKKKEGENHHLQNLKHLKMEREEKIQALRSKFDKQEENKKNVTHSLNEFMSAKKESNMYRMFDHNEKMKKIRRGQSAYKKNLVEKIIEKGNRGREISERKYRMSEIALHNSLIIRDQFHQGLDNLKEIDRN